MKLTFITGGSLRKVTINGKKLMFETPELAFEPLIVDLDRLSESKKKMEKMKLNEEQIKEIEDLAKLGDEESITQDIIKDFQKTGWRLVSRG